MIPGARTDAELVGDCLTGDRGAFAEIVRRYQTLVCSLAYSATGDLPRSEDLAQDTFLAVWRQLPELREPERLRAWVCGIARHRIQDSIRSCYREPTHRAAPLEHVEAAPAPEDPPSDEAVNREEAAIVWRALAQMPEMYREPLVLFHRENRSVERVAVLLELSEDAVKQRLVRGRRLLQAEVEAVVEGALRRTAPGRVFTSNVMQMLPVATLAAKTGTVAAQAALGAGAVAKGSVGGGAAGPFAFLAPLLAPPSPLAPLLIVFLERKVGLAREAAAMSEEERALAAGQRRVAHGVIILCAILIAGFGSWFKRQNSPPWYAPLVLLLTVVPLLDFTYLYALRTRWRIWGLWAKAGDARVERRWEYRSRRTLFGWPLVHIRLQKSTAPVKAWIAVGHVAYGACFAAGTVAVAPVCLGVFGLGLVGAGAFVAGGLVSGVQSVGIFAFGAVAVGWMASGLFAFGLHAAYGIEAYAGVFAGAPLAHAKWMAYALHANDAAAQEFFRGNPFFSWTRRCLHWAFHSRQWLAGLTAVFFLGWIVWTVRKLRRRPVAAPSLTAAR